MTVIRGATSRVEERPESTATWRRLVALAGILFLCVGWPLVLALVTGSLAVPHCDGWAYSLIAQHYASSGSVQLVGWNRGALVGQIVLLGPLGRSIVVQQLFVAVLACIGLLAVYGLLAPRVGRGGALLGTALVGLPPDFGLLATSYMSDIPAFTAVVGCLFLADQALRREDARYLLVGLAVGVWGVTVREQAVVGPVAAVVVTVAAWRGTKRRIALIAGMVSALMIVGFEAWRRSLPYDSGESFTPGLGLVLAVPMVVCGCLFVALAVFPAVLVTTRPRGWSKRACRWSVATLLVGILVVVAAQALGMGDVTLLSYLSPAGAYWPVSIGRRSVLPNWWWFPLLAMACVSLALIVGHVRSSLDKSAHIPLGIFRPVLPLIAIGTLVQALAGQAVTARYLLILIPIACVALLGGPTARPSLRRRLPALAVLAILAVTSTAITANALAFDAARWRAASLLAARGIPATDIDAGMEWDGYHASEPASGSSVHADATFRYMHLFKHSRQCYVVSASPLAGLRMDSTQQYRTYALLGSSKLWIYQVSPCR